MSKVGTASHLWRSVQLQANVGNHHPHDAHNPHDPPPPPPLHHQILNDDDGGGDNCLKLCTNVGNHKDAHYVNHLFQLHEIILIVS